MATAGSRDIQLAGDEGRVLGKLEARMNPGEITLDELFAQAKAHLRGEAGKRAAEAAKPRRTRAKDDAPEIRGTTLFYSLAENWTRIGGVALIHEETGTVLGNFSEYRHRFEPATTKLVREPGLIPVTETRSMSGSWWLEEKQRPEPQRPWHEQRSIVVHLHLGELKLHSPACEVVVFLSYGAIDRVELAADTLFAGEDGSQEQLVSMPAGTNVREVTSLDCKMAIRKELGI